MATSARDGRGVVDAGRSVYRGSSSRRTLGTLSLTVTPSSPSWPSSTPLGTVVATLQGVWSSGRPFIGDYVFVAPNFDDGGTYDIVLNADHSGSLRISPTGPGVGAAGGTVQSVTIEPRQVAA
jgi:hypothetical protein